jgi:hypothetical protein
LKEGSIVDDDFTLCTKGVVDLEAQKENSSPFRVPRAQSGRQAQISYILKPNRNGNDEAIHVVKKNLNRPIVNYRLMSPLARKALRSKLHGRN